MIEIVLTDLSDKQGDTVTITGGHSGDNYIALVARSGPGFLGGSVAKHINLTREQILFLAENLPALNGKPIPSKFPKGCAAS